MVSQRLSITLALWSVSALAAAPPSIGDASNLLRGLPIVFEPNDGRANRDVKFSARTSDYRLFLTSRGALFQPNAGKPRTISISMLNANRKAEIFGEQVAPGRTNYFMGANKENWRTDIANYARVRYRAVYPGIDLVYYGSGSNLEYDFLVRPGADPNRIRLQYQGMDRLSITPEGNLIVEAAGAKLVQKSPVVYQDIPGSPRRRVRGSFKLMSRNVACFEIESYDRSLPLTIDPVLTYSSLISTAGADAVTAVKIDRSGILYLAGYMTNAANLPASDSAFQNTAPGGADMFVAKINPKASGADSLLYLSYIGGSGTDTPTAMAVDSLGNVYLTGWTTSTNFPLAGNTPSATLSGERDAFIMKFQPGLQGVDALLYSTYLGGADIDAGNAIDIDSQGSIYVTGYTRSGDFPLTPSAYQAVRWGNQDGFITKLNPTAPSPLLYSSYLGGETTDEGKAILVAPSGAVYFAANTFSTTFPLAGIPWRDTGQGGGDIVVGQMDLTKSGQDSLVYVTYLSGSGLDEARNIALDPAGRILVTGTTLSKDFPVTADAFQTNLAGIANVFVTRLDLGSSRSSALSYSTYLGGSGADVAYGMGTDSAGNAYLTGYTLSPDFPTTEDALQRGPGGGIDVFIAKLALAGDSPGLAYSTYAGQSGVNVGYAIAIAPDGSICVGGQSTPRNLRTTDSAFQSSSTGGLSDGFVLILR